MSQSQVLRYNVLIVYVKIKQYIHVCRIPTKLPQLNSRNLILSVCDYTLSIYNAVSVLYDI